jgi:capsular polysaccharide biosynthesis protein
MNKRIRAAKAYLSYPFLGASGAGRRFGRVPYVPVDVAGFVQSTFQAPQPFLRDKPKGRPIDARWDSDPPYAVTQNSVALIPGGSANHDGYVFDADGRPVHGACHPRKQMLKYRWRTRRDGIAASYMQDAAHPRHFDGRLGVATATNQNCYYHWIFDILPRLHLAMAERLDRVYLQRKFPFQEASLAVLGVADDLIVNTEDEPWVSADELVVPCHQIMTGHHHPRWVVDWLREHFLLLAGEAPAARRRIFISRSIARNRRLVNEDEIWAILEPRGFEYVLAEKLPFAEQIAMFAGAEAVVAPHGAGLANLVFCAPGTRVVELFPSMTMDAYYRLSIDLDLDYAFVKTRQFRLHRRVGENFTVNPGDFSAVLDHMRL